MNTNINTARLAKVGGPETKESFAVIKRDRGALHSIKMGLATAVLFASVGMATAQQRYPAGANQYYGLYDPAQHVPLFHAQITFDTITRERVAARVSAQSPRCSISRREAGRPGEGACYYEYRRNGVLD
jgi:hypothetical protein